MRACSFSSGEARASTASWTAKDTQAEKLLKQLNPLEKEANELAEITQLIEAGKIKAIVSEALPLTDAVKASQQTETHHTRGKIVLKIAEEPKS